MGLKLHQGKRCLSFKTLIVNTLYALGIILAYKFILYLYVNIHFPVSACDRTFHHYFNITRASRIGYKYWNESKYDFCSLDVKKHDTLPKFSAYNNEFAYMEHVELDPDKFIKTDSSQYERSEYFTLKPGAFQINCELNRKYKNYAFHVNKYKSNHLDMFFQNTQFIDYKMNLSKITDVRSLHTDFTIVITRYEYTNIYHSMTDIFNAFLMMRFFDRSADNTQILFMDAHPESPLDAVWYTLFKSTIRINDLKESIIFKSMVWNPLGYRSPLYVLSTYRNLPLLDEFVDFFLKQHRVESAHEMNCGQLNILFIWRRNYVAHPRNPTGIVQRKIKNEDEILTHNKEHFSNHTVYGLQLDSLSMSGQLRHIVKADILIGMHGAGLIHTIFLPKKSTLIELYPSDNFNYHFKYLAKWKDINYLCWRSWYYEVSPGYSTYIKPSDIQELIQQAVHSRCHTKS